MKALVFVFISLCLHFPALGAEKIRVLTEIWEPYNYLDGDRPVGLSTELVKATFKKANIDYELEVLPWKRAYNFTLNDKNTAIFTITRTPAREAVFKWVGPLYPQVEYFYKLRKRSDIKVSRIDDLKAYVVGVLNGGSTQEVLLARGFQNGVNLNPVTKASQNLAMLFAERVDFVIGSDAKFVFQLKDNNLHKFEDLEKSVLLSDSGGYYLALNINTPDEIVNRLQKALDQLMRDGLRDAIWRKYLGPVPFEWMR